MGCVFYLLKGKKIISDVLRRVQGKLIVDLLYENVPVGGSTSIEIRYGEVWANLISIYGIDVTQPIETRQEGYVETRRYRTIDDSIEVFIDTYKVKGREEQISRRIVKFGEGADRDIF